MVKFGLVPGAMRVCFIGDDVQHRLAEDVLVALEPHVEGLSQKDLELVRAARLWRSCRLPLRHEACTALQLWQQRAAAAAPLAEFMGVKRRLEEIARDGDSSDRGCAMDVLRRLGGAAAPAKRPRTA